MSNFVWRNINCSRKLAARAGTGDVDIGQCVGSCITANRYGSVSFWPQDELQFTIYSTDILFHIYCIWYTVNDILLRIKREVASPAKLPLWWSMFKNDGRKILFQLNKLRSKAGIHAPLGPRTARCELVRYFSVFIGPGAVRSEFFKNLSVLVRFGAKFWIFVRSWCGAVRNSENNSVLVRCGPKIPRKQLPKWPLS